MSNYLSSWSHLRIDHHVHTLVDYVLGKVVQKVENVLDHRLVGQSAQPNAVLGGARRDEVLCGERESGMGHRRAEVSCLCGCEAVTEAVGTHLRQQRQLHRRQLGDQRRLAVPAARLVILGVHRPVEHLLHLGGCGAKELNVPLPNGLAMPAQRLRSIRLVGEQHKGISGGPSVGFLHKQHALAAVENMTGRRVASGEEVQLGEGEYIFY